MAIEDVATMVAVILNPTILLAQDAPMPFSSVALFMGLGLNGETTGD